MFTDGFEWYLCDVAVFTLLVTLRKMVENKVSTERKLSGLHCVR